MTVAIAAAGTGGHVYPALAVAEALLERGLSRDEVVFFGGDRMEAGVVPESGFRFVGFELTKLRRRLTVENLKIPLVLRRSGRAMAAELVSSGTKAVLGMSGYVTVPAALGAGRAGVPFFVHEQNAEPTLAARFGARRARATLLGLPGRSERLPRSEVVGNPLRRPLQEFDRTRLREQARRRYGLPDAGLVVGVLGGSLGAQVLNESVPAIGGVPGIDALLHLTGPEGHGVSTEEPSLPLVRIPFEAEMEHFYAAVDLVVCRAGAMTVSELAATATPAIFVPLERVGQLGNAEALASAGGARICRQDRIASLPAMVEATLADRGSLRSMGQAATGVARPDAAGTVADRVMEVVGGG